MQEELISFETAKLAKEKGFDVPTWDYFCPQGEHCNLSRNNWNSLNEPYHHTSRPTQSLLQKWLREVHNIIVETKVFDMGWLKKDKFAYDYRIYNKSYKDKDIYTSINEYSTYEEALEKGLLEALKLIK